MSYIDLLSFGIIKKTRVSIESGKSGKVREYENWSGKIRKFYGCQGKVREFY